MSRTVLADRITVLPRTNTFHTRKNGRIGAIGAVRVRRRYQERVLSSCAWSICTSRRTRTQHKMSDC